MEIWRFDVGGLPKSRLRYENAMLATGVQGKWNTESQEAYMKRISPTISSLHYSETADQQSGVRFE